MKEFYLLFMTVLLMSSCAQMTRFETGKTVGENNIQLSGQVTAYGTQQYLETAIFQGSLEYGVMERMDLGVSISSALSVLANAKFQLVGNQESRFALSLNPALELQLDPFIGLHMRKHVYIPMSYELNDRYTIIFEPRYNHAPQENTPHSVGGSSGVEIKMNGDWNLVIGGSLFMSPEFNEFRWTEFQFGLGAKKLFVRS